MQNNLTKEISELSSCLLQKLADKASNAGVKYEYYNANQELKDFGISLPTKMAHIHPGIGWATRAVNTLGDRLNFDGFANDRVSINETLQRTGAFNVLDKAKTDALIAGCSFVAIVKHEDEFRLIPFTATEATGEIDSSTGLLKYGLAVTRFYPYEDKCARVEWSNVGLIPADYYLFTENYTARFVNDELVDIIPNETKRPFLHVITHRQSADRPMGKARISNTVRRIVDEVGRLKVRYEVAAEFYSTPQRYINGLALGAEKDANLDSALGKVWTITKDEDDEKAEVGQLAQMSISQFSDQKKDLARDFCAETALTLRNLGYETSNPTSAESLSAMSDDLLLEAQECQKEMGNQFKHIAESLIMAENAIDNVPVEASELTPSWRPIFQLDLGAAGDALYKLFDIMPELKGTVTAYKMLGMGVLEAEQLAKKANSNTNGFMPTEVE